MRKIIFIGLSLLVWYSAAYAQLTKIRGVVMDASNGEQVSFANIYLHASGQGTTSDFDGKYYFETMKPVDSITATYVGYRKQSFAVKPGRYQEINFSLQPEQFNLAEVVVHAGENPADTLFRKIVQHKESNTMNKLNAWQYELYTKIQFDANNFGDRLKNARLLRPFDFVFDYVDTSTVNGKVYLPIFITETLSDVFISRNPDESLEKVKASRGSGIENPSIAKLIGTLKQEIHAYDNYITIFDKQFVGPLANFGLAYYRYYIVDSMRVDSVRYFKMAYKPRRKQELTFTGDFWVQDRTFAITKIEMNIASDANINFINDLSIRQEYNCIDQKVWMLTRDYMVADFNVTENLEKMPGFFGKRSASYEHFVLNEPKDPQFYRKTGGITLEAESMEKNDAFWNEHRHEKLSKKEEGIYQMVDSIEHVPIYRTYTDIIYMAVFGYAPWNKFEIGPLAKIYSFNSVEGSRFRLGGQTSTLFSKKLRLYGHLAYGTRDQRIKYKIGTQYMFNKDPQRSAGMSYMYDIEQLGSSFNAFSQDNILTTILRKQVSDKLNLARKFNLYYENEFLPGLSGRFEFEHRNLLPVSGNLLATRDENDVETEHKSLTSSELSVKLRYAYHEKVVINTFDRMSFGSDFPIVSLNYTYGIPYLFGSDYRYHRLQLGITDWYNVGSIGWSKYIIDAGKVFGKLPYPLLVLHPGNETFIFDEYAFNLANYYEFISDQYVSVYYTHHFDGFFLNKVPLMRKLKWREVIFAKGLLGSITDENLQYNVFPDISHHILKPYFEAGIGVENIFKIVRVDAVWRLSHNDFPDTHPFGVFVSLQFTF